MKTITLEDLQKLGRLLKGCTCRKLTEQEIENFYVIPEGATLYPDFKSFNKAREKLLKRNVHHQTFCNRDESLYWIKEFEKQSLHKGVKK